MNKTKHVSLEAVHTHTHTHGLFINKRIENINKDSDET